MIKRMSLGLAAVLVLLGLTIYATGNPGAAHAAWSRYQAALTAGRYDDAARLASRRLYAFEERQRLLALTAPELELQSLTLVELAGVLGTRAAVYDGRIDTAFLRTPPSSEALHAALRKVMPKSPLTDLSLLFVVPLSPNHSVGWMGPRQYSDSPMTWMIALLYGMRANFLLEDGNWRIDYLPMMGASARANAQMIGGADAERPFAYRRNFFNQMLASADPLKQKALWIPIETRLAAQ